MHERTSAAVLSVGAELSNTALRKWRLPPVLTHKGKRSLHLDRLGVNSVRRRQTVAI